MFEYYYSYYGENGYGIGLNLLDAIIKKYSKKYIKGSSSIYSSGSYYSSYYESNGIGLGNINNAIKYVKSYKKPKTVSYDYYYYGSGDSYGIGLSLLNF
jgi:hypothetical protein